MLTVIGNFVSPFVRKVLAVCEIKGLPYEIDPIIAFHGNDRFSALSPLRRIPVLIDGTAAINDSTVICEYLEDKWPERPVLPREPLARAEARFMEEFADSRLADVLIWKIFAPAVVAPAVFKAERNLEAITKAVTEELPGVMDFLERQAPAGGFLFGSAPGLADVSVAVHFANLRWARQTFDHARWPKASAWVDRVSQCEPMARLNAVAEQLLRVPLEGRRPVLEGLGVKVVLETVGTDPPRRGPMSVI